MNPLELQDSLRMRERLNQLSPSFCPVKWKHATISIATGSSKSCCHQQLRKVSLDNRKNGFQFHDTKEDQRERNLMLQGIRPENCAGCWWLEDAGHLSDRHTWSARSWLEPFVQDIENRRSATAESPSWLEVNFSSICNLKCSYCSPIFSNQWYKEIKEHGPYPTSPAHNDYNYLSNVEFNESFENKEFEFAFWKWFEEIAPGLRLLKVTGGEPLLNKNTFQLLNSILEKPNVNLDVSVNSNLCIPEKNWNSFMEWVRNMESAQVLKNFYLHPSLDCWGSRAEYIRYGLDFELFQNRLREYLEKTQGPVILICTLNNLALGGLREYWEKLYELKQTYGKNRWISVTTEILAGPAWQNINILPQSYQSFLEETLRFVEPRVGPRGEDFSQYELDGLKRALTAMNTKAEGLKQARANFYAFFKAHDERRGTDFLETFPELGSFWETCKQEFSSQNPAVDRKGIPAARWLGF